MARRSIHALLPVVAWAAMAVAAAAQPVVEVGGATSGALADGDATLDSGEWADAFDLPDGPASEVRVRADGFRPYLIVRGAAGAQVEVPAPDGWPAAVSVQIPDAGGPWTLVVTSDMPGEEGTYAIERRPLPPDTPLVGEAEGALTEASVWLSDGSFGAGYALASDGGPFEIRLSSLAFDPMLLVQAPSGATYANDDALGDASVSVVTVGAAEAERGAWSLAVTSAAPREHGPYRLSTQGLSEADAAAAQARQAAVDALHAPFATVAEALRVADYAGAHRAALGLAADARALGDDLPVVATALQMAALALSYSARFEEAAALYLEARAVHVRRHGEGHPRGALIDASLGDLYREAGRFEDAEAALTRALAAVGRTRPPDHPDRAITETNLGALYLSLGDDARAAASFRRGLEAFEARGAPADSSRWATMLSNLATALLGVGDADAAAEVTARSAAARPPGDPDAWLTLNTEGLLAYRLGRYREAEDRYVEALAEARRVHGAESRQASLVLRNHAEAMRARGAVVEARQALEQAIAADRATLPAGHPDLAGPMASLAGVLHDLGDAAAARERAEEALVLVEAAFDSSHVRVVEARHLAAILRFSLDDTPEARAARPAAIELLSRAVRDGAAANGWANPAVASAAANLARYLLLDGDAEASLVILTRVLDAQTALLPPGHPETARTRLTRANAHMIAGDLAAARADAQAATADLVAGLGAFHPMAVQAGSELALFTLLDGDAEAASAVIERVAADATRFAAVVLPTLSPSEQAAFSQRTLPDLTSAALTVAAEGGRGAYAAVGGWRGMVLQGLRRQAAAAALADDPALGPAVRRLLALRGALARAVAGGGEVDSLARAKEAAERALADALPALADPWADGGPPALAAALPPTSAFVDVYRYAHLGGALDGWRYAAVVTTSAGQRRVDLGEAGPLDAAAAAWRAGRDQPGGATAALGARLWTPIVAALPAGTRRVWVAPDGALVRLPWDVLAEAHDPAGPVVAQVPSARSLLGLLTSPSPAASGAALVVGGVDFGEGGGWGALPGTAREAEAVAATARAARIAPRVLSGPDATPGAVGQAVRGAAWIHLATHGYFGGTTASAYARGPRATDEEAPPEAPGAVAAGRNPLVETGLALAGANAGPAGLLTAEEVVGLDLSAARLVVLSACDTGRGAEVTGQGVLGLQAAVQAAGARALLMSLWPVDDAATAVLMDRFYTALWDDGQSPSDALRSAQAAVRERPAWAAPTFWAGWALVGDVF